jgi:hypothetical protein
MKRQFAASIGRPGAGSKLDLHALMILATGESNPMKPDVRLAELEKQHERAQRDWAKLIDDPATTVEIVFSPAGEHPQPHADLWALSIVTPYAERGFWMATAASDGAARLLAADLGLKVASP